jgi:small GTP-binding protein
MSEPHRQLAHRVIADLYQHWSKLPAPQRDPWQSDLDQLQTLIQPEYTLTLAAFGLVNRGKSAVLNALLGDPILAVGPLNGVTHSTHRLQWAEDPDSEQVVELLDTPGLNEVEGQVRAQLAWTAAQQADLILFVIAGDLSQIEYEALLELRTLHKPILLVFNKIDLYPDHDREAIYAQITSPHLRQLVSPDEILMVAAAPKPNRVRIHWPDNSITHDWERPQPQIEPLKAKLKQVLQQEAESLTALNRLVAAGSLHDRILARQARVATTAAQQDQWRAIGLQALGVGLCPIWPLDLGIMALVNLGLVAKLSQDFHGSPGSLLSAYRSLLQPLGVGLGILTAVNLGSGVILGLDPFVWINGALVSPLGVGSGVMQAVVSGFWTHRISRVVQAAIQTGSRLGPGSPRAAIKTLLNQLSPRSIMSRLRQEVRETLELADPAPGSTDSGS